MKKIVLIMLLIFITGCSKKYTLLQTPNQEVATQPANYTLIDYIIQPQDRLMITSYNHKDLMPTNLGTNGVLVDANGDVSLPLVHRVHLAGLTQTEAAKKLERLYSRYLKHPSFNVEAINKKVYVLGEVKSPGSIDMTKDQITILEAIAQSGGLGDNAIRDNIIVLSRDASGRMRMRKVDLTNFNALQATNILLNPNDIVYVQPNNWKHLKVTADNIGAVTKVISNIATPYFIFK